VKALVTGATGFIGGHIVRYLLSSGFRVRALVRNRGRADKLAGMDIELTYGDVLEVDSLRKCYEGVDLIYSCVGMLGRWGTPEGTYRKVNAEGVRNLLENCPDGRIRQFIHISSAGVLGPLRDGVIADESFPYSPSNIYEQTKCEAEKIILALCPKKGIPFTIIRPEFVYGPGDLHVLGLFKAIQRGRFALMGDGESLLHPTYIDDLIHGIHLCTGNRKAMGQIYLITGDRPVKVRELVEIIAGELGVTPPRIKIPPSVAYLGAGIMERVAKLIRFNPPLTKSRVRFFTENRAFSSLKAHVELGYTPQVDLREGVRRTIRWYREAGYL